MKEFVYTIKDENGIHARPAGILVKEAAKFECNTTIFNGEKSADAKRLFAVMGLGVKKGTQIKMVCNGPDEETAASTLQSFVEENL